MEQAESLLLLEGKSQSLFSLVGFPCGPNDKEPADAGHIRAEGLIPWLGRSLGEGHGIHSSILAHRQKSLAGYGPWGRKESDATEET